MTNTTTSKTNVKTDPRGLIQPATAARLVVSTAMEVKQSALAMTAACCLYFFTGTKWADATDKKRYFTVKAGGDKLAEIVKGALDVKGEMAGLYIRTGRTLFQALTKDGKKGYPDVCAKLSRVPDNEAAKAVELLVSFIEKEIGARNLSELRTSLGYSPRKDGGGEYNLADAVKRFVKAATEHNRAPTIARTVVNQMPIESAEYMAIEAIKRIGSPGVIASIMKEAQEQLVNIKSRVGITDPVKGEKASKMLVAQAAKRKSKSARVSRH